MMKTSVVFIYLIAFSSLCAESFKMSDNAIKTNISYQNLNRITVKGDKIDSILGIETAFHIEKHDKTGDAFIRPTEDNAYNPISLSVVTTSGKTQDLLLNVVDSEAKNIELISEEIEQRDLSEVLDISASSEDSSGSDYEETISGAMKKFINISASIKGVEVTGAEDRNYAHIKATFESGYRMDGFLCLKYKITTDKEDHLDERMFSKKGDIALSLSELTGKSRNTYLYVLRK